MTVIYPQMEDELNQQPPKYLNNLLAHLDHCKDVCDHFGITTVLVPYYDKQTKRIIGFTSKSFKNPKGRPEDDFEFEYDPMWDDGTDFDSLYKSTEDDEIEDPYPEIVNKVPDDDEEIIERSKDWVQVICSDMGICPFSPSATQAGIPIGPVHYEVTRATTVEDMYTKFWEEVIRVEQQDEKDISTTLLVAPEFFMDNVELYESFCNTLTQPLTALKVEELMQLIFFHPHWSFRDGGNRATEGQAANYARRSPWPMINILRTKQVRTAQRGIPTGLVYKQNEKTLGEIGVDDLETMLRLRDWSGLEDKKVNRREIDAIKIAQDVQATGKAKDSDTNLANDATPVANRVVDQSQVVDGDLVRVLSQALEKRLGKDDGVPKALSGPETSATSMASEYLLQALDQVAESNGGVEAPEESSESASDESSDVPPEIAAARKAKMDEARRMLMSDFAEDSLGPSADERGSEINDVLFGGSGVDARTDADDDMDAFNAFQNN